MRIITNKIQLPNWVLYVLPDGLWLFSFMSLQFFIWKNEIKKNNLIWIISLPILAICSEIGQFFKFIPGTFDVLDLLVYLIGTFFPFIVYKNQLIFKVN